MADIDNSISYSQNSKNIIEQKSKDPNFSHNNWGDEDLVDLRREIRNFYKEEQKGICSFCKKDVSLISAMNCTVEHIVPKSLHLDYIFVEKNLCVICADCNQIKREQETLGEIPETIKNSKDRKKYPRSSNAFKIVHPHFDNYDDHIFMTNGFYVDKSVKGHFTIGACKLNRKLHVFGREEVSNDALVSELTNQYLEEDDYFKGQIILEKLNKILAKK